MRGWFPRIRPWLLVVSWMAVIYVGSTDLMSSRNTSRFIGPLLRWFWPSVAAEQIRFAQMIVRKSGHLTEYALLAALVAHAARLSTEQKTWVRRHAMLAFTVAVCYAVLDELHQSTVVTRQGSAYDVLIDAFGAVIGLTVWWWYGKRRKAS